MPPSGKPGDLWWTECEVIGVDMGSCTATLRCVTYLNIFGYWFEVDDETEEAEIEGCSPDSGTVEV